jgi:peptidoglycan hydrolase-like protein with peptidoglycan-binding domain
VSYSLTWLPSVLEATGLKVAEVSGWETRGRGEMGMVKGVLCHHTAGARAGNMPSLQVLIDGRPDLPGPLAQLGLGRDGTFYVVAAGRCNHAGAGCWMDQNNGNYSFIGIEAENTGRADDPWPKVQLDAYQRGAAAILRKLQQPAEYCAGHKEFALPQGRKSDPNFDMVDFRQAVADLLAGAPTPQLIPAEETSSATSTSPPRPTLRRGASGDLVKYVQARVGAAMDGIFGGWTEAAVRRFQQTRNMVPDGIVGPKTWAALYAVAL